MPSSWALLPRELLEAIFDKIEDNYPILDQNEEHDFSVKHTRKRCLLQLMLTCKHWSSIAKEAFYNEQFTLDVDTANKLSSDKTTPQLFIKNIAITCELASDASLIKLLSMCPDVTYLRVLGCLNDVEVPSTQESFYTSLYVLSQSNHLAKLRSVEFELQRAQTDQVLARHQQAMLQLKHSLTHLQIVDGTMNKRHYNVMEPPQRFVEWFDQLQYFPRLTTVRIDVGSLAYLYEMDGFIEKMGPTVTTIIIGLVNTTRVLQPLKRINPATIARRSLTNTLKLDILTIRAQDLNYVVHKFDNLSELQISIIAYRSNVASSLNEEFRSDDSLLKRFFEYLTGISKFMVTNILIHNSLLRQALVDLKKCFQIKHLTLSNIVSTCAGTTFSIKSLSIASDGHRRQVNLDLEIGTAQLLSVARLVYEVLREDVVELQFGYGLIKHYNEKNRIPCPVQGEALQLGIHLLPLLKTLTSKNPRLNPMKSIVNPKAPKLALDLLVLGNFILPEVLLQMSQRIKHIEKWMTIYIPTYCDENNTKLHRHVFNMPFTTFGKIYIATPNTGRFIVKLSTSSNTTFYSVYLNEGTKFSTEKDCYYQQDDNVSQEYDRRDKIDGSGQVHIICADVKRLTVANTQD